VSAIVLSLKLPAAPALTLSEQLPTGRLIEITRAKAGAQLTTAVACLRAAQAQGQTAAWIQPEGGSLFPPDLAQSGIDLDALLVVHVPARAGAHGLPKAAELLLRSGGFGMVVLDLSDLSMQRGGAWQGAGQSVWQGRLLGLAREHESWLLLLTHSHDGSLISLCLEPHRQRVERGVFTIEQRVRKDKSGMLCPLLAERRRGPWGLL
jgi:recombination protein RecA